MRQHGAALSADAKRQAQQQIVILRKATGAVSITGAEVGATVVIDGRLRGEYPLPGPLNVMAGAHLVRVYKERFKPFEKSVDVAQGQTVSQNVELEPLVHSGKLRVEETGGKTLDVVVDGVPVGVTPWEGPLSVGDHSVLLRSLDSFGTLPASVKVKRSELTKIKLTAEQLGASIKVVPAPATASVLLDGFFVGRGPYEGRLRPGEHAIKVVADGYFDEAQKVNVKAGDEKTLTVELKKDPSSPLWREPGHFVVEAAGGVPIGGTFGGDLAAGCTGSCVQGAAVGGRVVVHGGYELSNGFGFGLSLGYLGVQQDIVGREATLTPEGLPADHGVVDDTLRLRGFSPGVWASYRFGERLPIRLRASAGALLGSMSDTRTGRFQPGGSPSTCSAAVVQAAEAESSPCFTTGPVIQAPFAAFIFVEPEVRIGYRIGERFEVSAGVAALLLFGVSVPSWDADQGIYAGKDGFAQFGADKLAGSFVPLIVPGLGARYEF